jgi:AcrR family transcriptional regulator
MSPRTTDDQAHDKKRQAILLSALRVFAREGYGSTRIQDIANEAGTSSALLYHYFRDRDAVFSELVRLATASSLGAFDLAVSAPGGPARGLYVLFDTVFHYAFAGDGPLFFLIMIQAMTFRRIPSEVQALLEASGGSYVTKLLPLIVAGQACGEVRDADPLSVVGTILALIQGFAIVQAQSVDRLPLPAIAEVLRCVLTEKGIEALKGAKKNE